MLFYGYYLSCNRRWGLALRCHGPVSCFYYQYIWFKTFYVLALWFRGPFYAAKRLGYEVVDNKFVLVS